MPVGTAKMTGSSNFSTRSTQKSLMLAVEPKNCCQSQNRKQEKSRVQVRRNVDTFVPFLFCLSLTWICRTSLFQDLKTLGSDKTTNRSLVRTLYSNSKFQLLSFLPLVVLKEYLNGQARQRQSQRNCHIAFCISNSVKTLLIFKAR